MLNRWNHKCWYGNCSNASSYINWWLRFHRLLPTLFGRPIDFTSSISTSFEWLFVCEWKIWPSPSWPISNEPIIWQHTARSYPATCGHCSKLAAADELNLRQWFFYYYCFGKVNFSLLLSWLASFNPYRTAYGHTKIQYIVKIGMWTMKLPHRIVFVCGPFAIWHSRALCAPRMGWIRWMWDGPNLEHRTRACM